MFGRSSVGPFTFALMYWALPAQPTLAGGARQSHAAATHRSLRTEEPLSRPGPERLSVALLSRADTETVTPAVIEQPREQLVEFHRHVRSNRMGYFVNEEKIAALHVQYASDAVRQVPGVKVRPSKGIGNQVRIRGCAPLVWVDGQRTAGAELDEVTHGSDVAAIEVYRSLAGVPAELADRSATCGTIVVWLKVD